MYDSCYVVRMCVLQLRGMVPEGMCIHVNPSKAHDQALDVFDHLNVEVTPSDIFARCQVVV